jgi:predicted phage-related endonuclease
MTGPQEWGLRLEEPIARAFADQMGLKFEDEVAKPVTFFVDPECEYIRSNLDYETSDGIPVECKTADRATYKDADGTEHRWGQANTDEVSAEYLCQTQTQIAAKGADYCYLAALIGGNDFRVYRINRSEKIIARIRSEGRRFWEDHVLAKNIPPHDWKHPRTPEFVIEMSRMSSGTKINLPAGDPVHEAARRHKALGELEGLVEKARKAERARILEMIGDVAEVNFGDGSKIVRKLVNRASYPVKATTYEQMTVTWKGEPIQMNIGKALPGLQPLPPEEKDDE